MQVVLFLRLSSLVSQAQPFSGTLPPPNSGSKDVLPSAGVRRLVGPRIACLGLDYIYIRASHRPSVRHKNKTRPDSAAFTHIFIFNAVEPKPGSFPGVLISRRARGRSAETTALGDSGLLAVRISLDASICD